MAVKPPVTPVAARDEEAKRYTSWLRTQASRDADEKERLVYARLAKQSVREQGKIRPFAPIREQSSAIRTFYRPQLYWIAGTIGLLVLSSVLFGLATYNVLITLVILGYTFHLALSSWSTLRILRTPAEERIPPAMLDALAAAPWPSYTVLCPLYKEGAVVPQFIRAMSQLDYPQDKLEILLLVEEEDHETQAAIQALEPLPPSFHLLIVPPGAPKTKPRACNYGLTKAHGDYIVIYDAEDVPEPAQIKKAVLTFANHTPDLACVQAKLNFYNPYQNILTRLFTIEYSLWFDCFLPAMQSNQFALPLGGTSNHFRTSVLRALGGWDAFNVTEDADLGMRLSHYQFRTAMLDSTTYEEANPDLKNWIRQRSRWIKGYMQTYLVHMRRPLHDLQQGRARPLFSLQVLVGGATATFFINPCMWACLLVYIAFRTQLDPLYHTLFSPLSLYLGTGCFIFGNIFYLYVAMLACLERKQYRLVKWCFLLPVYWLLMSVAACKSFWQLLFKPHYWEKTQHGLHLKQGAQPVTTWKAAKRVTEEVEAVDVTPLLSLTASVKAIRTLPMPAVQRTAAARVRTRNLWPLLIGLCATLLSIGATWYYYQQHEILLYGDAISHLRIARDVFDSLTPGIAQLGGVWLPLPHVLMWLFVWNDPLWQSGLVGSLVGMPCYVLTAVLLFHICYRLTRHSFASFLGVLAFLLNANVLYLQATPLSEMVCIASYTLVLYFMLRWIEEHTTWRLVLLSCSVFLVTLARYDGWPLALAVAGIISYTLLREKYSLRVVEGTLIVFYTVGLYGILLWLIWNKLLFGNFFFFKQGAFSASTQQLAFQHNGKLFSYHDIIQSVRFYTVDVMQNCGPALFLVACGGAILYTVTSWRSSKVYILMLTVVPFAFYIYSLYTGDAILWIPGANPPGVLSKHIYMFNVRYGVIMILFVTLGIACGCQVLFHRVRPVYRPVILSLLALLIVGQSVLLTITGVVTVQDGQYYTSCLIQKTMFTYMAQHYNGGLILEDIYTTEISTSQLGIHFSSIVYEGSNIYWKYYLAHPERGIEWVLVSQGSPNDVIAKSIDFSSPNFRTHFELVAQQSDRVQLYHRRGSHIPLANRPAPPVYNYPHVAC